MLMLVLFVQLELIALNLQLFLLLAQQELINLLLVNHHVCPVKPALDVQQHQ